MQLCLSLTKTVTMCCMYDLFFYCILLWDVSGHIAVTLPKICGQIASQTTLASNLSDQIISFLKLVSFDLMLEMLLFPVPMHKVTAFQGNGHVK